LAITFHPQKLHTQSRLLKMQNFI